MSEVNNYLVTQTRVVHVMANNANDAVRIASSAFKTGNGAVGGVSKDIEDVRGNTTDVVRETSLLAEKVR